MLDRPGLLTAKLTLDKWQSHAEVLVNGGGMWGTFFSHNFVSESIYFLLTSDLWLRKQQGKPAEEQTVFFLFPPPFVSGYSRKSKPFFSPSGC